MRKYFFKSIILLCASICLSLVQSIGFASMASPSNYFSQTQDRFWLSSEYLQWFFQSTPLRVPLVTSGSLLAPLPGALGQFGTRISIGDQSINTGWHSGGRFTLGYWLDKNNAFGIEGIYFFFPSNVNTQHRSTTGQLGSQTLAVPVYDISGFTSNNSPGESIYVLPGPFSTGPGFAGKFTLVISNRLQGAETNGQFNIYNICNVRVDVSAGLRWVQLNEGLIFNVKTSGVPATPTVGQFFNSEDKFKTQNNFYGVQFGIRTKYDNFKFFGQASAKMALGYIHETANIQGHAMTSNGTLFFPVHGFTNRIINGGIFAQPSNIGKFHKNHFAIVPELDLKLGYHVNNYVNLLTSYGFMYISSIARPGNQINRKINTTRTGLADASRASGTRIAKIGPSSPSFKFHHSNFFAQGVSIGLEINC